MGASAPDKATQVWDLAEWVKPYSQLLFGQGMDALYGASFGINRYQDASGKETLWTGNPIPDWVREKYPDLDIKTGGAPPGKYVGHQLLTKGDLVDEVPMQQMRKGESFNPIDQQIRSNLLDELAGGNPLIEMINQQALSHIQPSTDLASNYEAYITGGPLAGATRTQYLDALTGNTQKYADQAALEAMFGKTANAGDQALYQMMTGDRGMTQEQMYRTLGGPEATYARNETQRTLGGPEAALARNEIQRSMGGPEAALALTEMQRTLRGDYLDPDTSPWLDKTFQKAAALMTDEYKSGTQPGIASQFARGGSFGGSAHQETEAAGRYGYGRNLEELATDIFGQAREQERQRQSQFAGTERNRMTQAAEMQQRAMLETSMRERGFTQDALQNRLNQEGQIAAGLMTARQGTAEAERQGWRTLLQQERQLGGQTSQQALDRLLQWGQVAPELRKGEFLDWDYARIIGSELNELDWRNMGILQENKDKLYQNEMAKFEWPFRALEILGGVIGGGIGNTGTTITAGGGGGGTSPAAQAIGTGIGGVQLINALLNVGKQ